MEETAEPPARFSKKIQYMALISTCFIAFGDSVEVVLPSVITQPVSCQLNVTPTQEHVLALAMYFTFALCLVISGKLSDMVGRRILILLSMYLAIAVTVFCAVVPNFKSLLASRILLGVVISLNLGNVGVYFTEIAGSKKFYLVGMTLSVTAYTLGGGWCGLLGYFFLEKIGWRYFVLITSVPLFLPPLILFQFFLPESHPIHAEPKEKEKATERTLLQIAADAEVQTDPTLKWRVARRMSKLCLYTFAHGFPYYGAILLVPSLVREENKRNSSVSPCAAIHGSQFLIITVLLGLCHLIGRGLSFLAQGRVRSGTILVVCGFVSLGALVLANFVQENVVLVFTMIGIVQVFGAASVTDLALMTTEKAFFTSRYLSMASSVRGCVMTLSIAFGNMLAEVLPSDIALIVHAVFWAISIPLAIALLFKD